MISAAGLLIVNVCPVSLA